MPLVTDNHGRLIESASNLLYELRIKWVLNLPAVPPKRSITSKSSSISKPSSLEAEAVIVTVPASSSISATSLVSVMFRTRTGKLSEKNTKLVPTSPQTLQTPLSHIPPHSNQVDAVTTLLGRYVLHMGVMGKLEERLYSCSFNNNRSQRRTK